jgi:hypothetical protein
MQEADPREGRSADALIVGAGAAGMMAAICVRRARPAWRVVALEGAARLGAKLLASGGGRCNLTHRTVTERDYHGGSDAFVRRVLRACDVAATLRFFHELGVATAIEAGGKVFPADNQARTVLRALEMELRRAGVILELGAKVVSITPRADGFLVATPHATWQARRVLLATGGCAWPRSGSDGTGLALAASLGHQVVPAVPALVPLLLDGCFHQPLSGVSLPVELRLSVDGRRAIRCAGALLFTRQGISGPVVLDISRHYTRARQAGRATRLTANLLPCGDFEKIDAWLLACAAAQPRAQLRTILSERMPAAVARAVIGELELCETDARLAHLPRAERRRLIQALLDWTLPVRASAGFDQAETTAGGVSLQEVRADSLESRLCPGLYLAGEVLDVDGRLGGFNLQWAWSSAQVAARGLSSLKS